MRRQDRHADLGQGRGYHGGQDQVGRRRRQSHTEDDRHHHGQDQRKKRNAAGSLKYQSGYFRAQAGETERPGDDTGRRTGCCNGHDAPGPLGDGTGRFDEKIKVDAAVPNNVHHQQHDDRNKGSLKRRIAVNHHGNEGQERDDEGRPFEQDHQDRFGIAGVHRARLEAIFDGLHVDHEKDRREEQQRRNNSHLHDVGIGRADDLGHDEGRRPHHRRHDLATGGDHRLDGPGLVRLVAFLFHHRDGQRPSDRHVARRRAGYHAQQGGENDRCLGARRQHAPCQAAGQPEEEITGAEFTEESAVDGKHDDIGRRNADRNAVDPQTGGGQEFRHANEAVTAAVEDAGQVFADKRIGEEGQADQRQEQADTPPRPFQHQEQNDDADITVHGFGVAAAEGDFLPSAQQVNAAADGGGNQDQAGQAVQGVAFQPL